MAVALCATCARPLYLPPGYAGALCPGGHTTSVASLPSQVAPGAPSPTALPGQEGTFGPSSASKKGWSGQPEPTVSTGRRPEKGTTGTPIQAADKPAGLEGDWKPDRDAQERADAWFRTKFFKKGGIGDDEWKPILAACKAWGLPDRAKWRDWLKGEWEQNRANAVRVLITAKAIESKEAEAVADSAPTSLRSVVLSYLQRADIHAYAQGWRKDDIAKAVGKPVGQVEQMLDKLVDEAVLYSPMMGAYRAMEAKE